MLKTEQDGEQDNAAKYQAASWNVLYVSGDSTKKERKRKRSMK